MRATLRTIPNQDNSALSEAEILRFDRQFSEVSANDEDFVLFDFTSGKAESEYHAANSVANEVFEAGTTADVDTMAENNREQSISYKLCHCDFANNLICLFIIFCILLLVLVPFVHFILKWVKKQ